MSVYSLSEYAKREQTPGHLIISMEAPEKKSVALITMHSWVGVSPSVINTARFLSSQGYSVDMYMSNTSEKFRLPNFDHSSIRIIKPKDKSKLIIRDIQFYNRYFSKNKRYLFIIGFDPNGLIRAGIVGILSRTPYIFHSLEFFELNKSSRLRKKFLKYLEVYFSKRALFTFTQDSLKADILARDNKIKREKVNSVYNSPIGDIITEKKNYFRDRFGIPKNKKLVLATGSLIAEHCIDEIIESTQYWSDKFVLVLHGWIPKKDFEKYILSEVEKSNGKILLSTDLFDDDEKYTIFQSVDIGLVFFKPINKNMKYGAASAGKLYNFMRVGVPIIGNDIPGMKTILEDNGCGIAVKDSMNISKALEKVDENYEFYSGKSYETYPRFEFTNCYREILPQILEGTKKFTRRFLIF